MAGPLLLIRLSVLFFALCKVAESTIIGQDLWEPITFRELFDTMKDCPMIPNLPVQADDRRCQLTFKLRAVVPVGSTDGRVGLILEGDNDGEYKAGDLFTKSVCNFLQLEEGVEEAKPYNKIMFTNSRSETIRVVVDRAGLLATHYGKMLL
eukprot:GHVS01006564.1.p1 GENE.GHVS01006564.1~~GHVS01006564.1.p1  ORF type:complete len:151 (+),score=9.95 GHVS01006564.1:217-669(+)